jgi:hypothetical protein
MLIKVANGSTLFRLGVWVVSITIRVLTNLVIPSLVPSVAQKVLVATGSFKSDDRDLWSSLNIPGFVLWVRQLNYP